MKPAPWLLPVSWIFGAGVAARNLLYDTGILAARQAGIPVLSVGNIAAGGRGKTPMVELLARRLRDLGRRTAILSRGYGRSSYGFVVVSNGRQTCAEANEAGDEPAQMSGNLPGVIIAVDENRVRGAEKLIHEFNPEVIILDDGFQHRSLARTKDIVLISPADIDDKARMLPAGYLREPITAVRRADLLGITAWKTDEEFRNAEQIVRELGKDVIGLKMRPVGFRRLASNEPVTPGQLGNRLLAVSGVANPRQFEESVREYLSAPVWHAIFDDHHRYTEKDLMNLVNRGRALEATAIVTTQKDAVRLRIVPGFAAADARIPWAVLEASMTVVHGEDHLSTILEAI